MRRRRKKTVAVVAVAAGAALLVARSCGRSRPLFFPTRGTVRSVVDGDSFSLTNGARIRMLELDAPEMRGGNKRLAEEARRALAGLIDRKEVRLERGPRARDRYDRFLAYVFVRDRGDMKQADARQPHRAGTVGGGAGQPASKAVSRPRNPDEREIFVNAEIVRRGLARARLWGAAGGRWEDILAAEREAREARRGMWGAGEGRQ